MRTATCLQRSDFAIVDTRTDEEFNGWQQYGEARGGHIPGAVHSDSDIYENDYPRWFLLPDDQVHSAMAAMGITEDTTVIVYSDSNIFSARLWWILTYAGVKDVYFYCGGGYRSALAFLHAHLMGFSNVKHFFRRMGRLEHHIYP